jgi:hypothetical protein
MYGEVLAPFEGGSLLMPGFPEHQAFLQIAPYVGEVVREIAKGGFIGGDSKRVEAMAIIIDW